MLLAQSGEGQAPREEKVEEAQSKSYSAVLEQDPKSEEHIPVRVQTAPHENQNLRMS